MGTPVERLAGKIVGVATTVRGLFSCERTQPPIRKTHHTKSIHDLIMTPSKFHPFLKVVSGPQIHGSIYLIPTASLFVIGARLIKEYFFPPLIPYIT